MAVDREASSELPVDAALGDGHALGVAEVLEVEAQRALERQPLVSREAVAEASRHPEPADHRGREGVLEPAVLERHRLGDDPVDAQAQPLAQGPQPEPQRPFSPE